jgi:hypothetical protein
MALKTKPYTGAVGFIQWCREKHDIGVNQKYDGNLPYSKHLDYVMDQHEKFEYLLPDGLDRLVTRLGCAGHDLIEDARVTYNDVRDICSRMLADPARGLMVADIIYCCTEEKGKNRDERHSEKYYKELAENRLAVFVKLCDIIANVKYGILTNSNMLEKHRAEHDKTLKYLYRKEFHAMYEYLDHLFAISKF